MNTYEFTHKDFNGGKPVKVRSPLNEEYFSTQLNEVFDDQQYKEGRYKKDMDVIVDIGANMGLTALYFKDYAKKIYALEPSKAHFEALVENVKDYPNIIPLNIGIAARSNPDYLVTNGPGVVPESFFGDGQVQELVQLLTLDDFFKQYGIEHVDLLKIDTEGGEYIIFPSEGFRKAASKVEKIIGESHLIRELYPQFIPPLLEEVGFKTKFLPIDNIFKEMSFTDVDTGEKRTFRVYFQTMFMAERKAKNA